MWHSASLLFLLRKPGLPQVKLLAQITSFMIGVGWHTNTEMLGPRSPHTHLHTTNHRNTFDISPKSHMGQLGGDGDPHFHSHTSYVAGNQWVFYFKKFNSNSDSNVSNHRKRDWVDMKMNRKLNRTCNWWKQLFKNGVIPSGVMKGSVI